MSVKSGRTARGRKFSARGLFYQYSDVVKSLTARGESLAAFDGRCIPKPPQRGCRVGGPGAGCVAPRSNTPGIATPPRKRRAAGAPVLGRRALPAGRLARLGATPDFHHGPLI